MSDIQEKLPGLAQLFRDHGLIDEHGNPTEEGQKALLEEGNTDSNQPDQQQEASKG